MATGPHSPEKRPSARLSWRALYVLLLAAELVLIAVFYLLTIRYR